MGSRLPRPCLTRLRPVTVIGNYVYLDGGELSQVVDGKPPANQSYISNIGPPSTHFLSISLPP